MFLGPAPSPSPSSSASFSSIISLSTRAVQRTVPLCDDGHERSIGPRVLWLSTHAVQRTAATGDDDD